MLADVKYDARHATKGVIEHQGFKRAVGRSAPVFSGEKGIADSNGACGFIQIVKSGTADRLACGDSSDKQRPA